MDALRIEEVLDLRDPRGLGGIVLRRVEASHRAVGILRTIGAEEIIAMRSNAVLTRAMRRALQAEVDKITNARERVDTFNALGLVIDTGRAAGIWAHESLGAMLLHPMAASCVSVDTAAVSRESQWMRDAFARHMPQILASDDPVALRGAAILALILFDALLAPVLIDALGDVGQFELIHAKDRSSKEDRLRAVEWITLRYRDPGRRQEARWRVRHWPVGPFAAAIFARLIECGGMHGQPRQQLAVEAGASSAAAGASVEDAYAVVPVDAALQAITDALGDRRVPASRKAIMRLARAYWSLRLPPYLVHLASDASAVESLPAEAFFRLIHGRRARGASHPPRIVRHWSGRNYYQYAAASPDQRLHLRALKDLRLLLRNVPRNPFSAEQVVRARLGEWFKTHAAVGGWCTILARWVAYAIGRERIDERGKALRPNSVQRYLGSYAPWLISLCHQLDPARVDEVTLMDHLDQLSALNHQASAGVRYIALQEFLEFAEKFGGPRVELTDWWGAAPKGGVPRANLVTPREYDLVLRRIDQVWGDRVNAYGRRRMRVMFIVAYWCGLRWSELAWLPLAAVDVHGKTRFPEATLEVRSSKTFFGQRSVPLHQLLPRGALEEVMGYVRDLRAGMFGAPPEGCLLFGEPGDATRVPSRSETHDVLQRVMRWVSGDESMIFHDLRHGAATYVALRILMPPDTQWPAWLAGIGSDAFALPDGFASWADWLSGRPHHDHQRCAPLAALLGHIDAHVTLHHYTHLSELLLHAWTQRHPPRVPDQVMAQVLGIKPATLKQRRTRARSRGVRGCTARNKGGMP